MEDSITPIPVYLVISQRNDKPCLEIRRVTTDPNLIKIVLTSAFHDRPMIIQPIFRNKLKSISTLQNKGIIYREKDSYYFVI